MRYDPADHAKIVVAAAYMPRGGPRTPDNLKLLEFLAGSFLILLTISRITRPRTLQQDRFSSTPLGP